MIHPPPRLLMFEKFSNSRTFIGTSVLTNWNDAGARLCGTLIQRYGKVKAKCTGCTVVQVFQVSS